MVKTELCEKYSRRGVTFSGKPNPNGNCVKITKGEVVIPSYLCCLGNRLNCKLDLTKASHKKIRDYQLAQVKEYPMLLILNPKKGTLRDIKVDGSSLVTIMTDGIVTRTLPPIDDTVWQVPIWSEQHLSCQKLVVCNANVTDWLKSIGINEVKIPWTVSRVGCDAWTEAKQDYIDFYGKDNVTKLIGKLTEWYGEDAVRANHFKMVDAETVSWLTSGALFYKGEPNIICTIETASFPDDGALALGDREITHSVYPDEDGPELDR